MGRIVLALIVIVLFVLAYLGWGGVIGDKNPLSIWIWVPYSILGSIIGYFIIAFLDRERRVRFFHFFTILSVLLVTAPVAAFFNDHSPAKLVTVGFAEEGMKILPVLLLAIYVPNLIRTRKDGIVYGALAGMGFNIIELGLYIANLLHESTVLETLIQQSARFGLWGLSAHIIWSAFVGMGIGFAAESTGHGWAKWKRFVWFYLIAAIMHSANDLGLLSVGLIIVAYGEAIWRGIPVDIASGGREFGPINDGMRYGTYVYNLALIVVMFVQIRKSFGLENKLQVEQLATEDRTVISERELNQVKGERLFFKRRYREFPKPVGAKIVLYQNLLAMQKHTATQRGLAVDKIKPVATLRQGIQALRAQSSSSAPQEQALATAKA